MSPAAVRSAVNWGTYIYGVNSDHVIQTSLGYFINPLLSVAARRVRVPRAAERGAMDRYRLSGQLAVVVITVDYEHLPWIALILRAALFGSYGLVKKKADVEAVESLTFETLVLTPVALGYLVWLWQPERRHLRLGRRWRTSLLLASTGLVTALPLICFGAAAIRISMTTIGLLQYLAPTIQFALGLLVFHEAMTPVKWIGFALVWLALAIFTGEALRHHRRTQLRLAAEASAI